MTSYKRWTDAGVEQANSLGGILGCKMAFYELFPHRKAQGCCGEDFVDGEHGGMVERFYSSSSKRGVRSHLPEEWAFFICCT